MTGLQHHGGISTKSLASLLCLCLLSAQSGCVALNIPSTRIADPNDSGGLFGDYRNKRPASPFWQPQSEWNSVAYAADHSETPLHSAGTVIDGGMVDGVTVDGVTVDGFIAPSSPRCLDGGPLVVDPFDDSVDQQGVPKTPEVPWPRFHPVPTRPVFGG